MKNLKETLARIVRDKNQREGKTLEDVIDEQKKAKLFPSNTNKANVIEKIKEIDEMQNQIRT